MARIPYFDPAQAEGDVKKLYERIAPLNIFRMMGHAGDLFPAFSRFGNQILAKMDLDPVLREIAIIRVGVLSSASYEVHQHERIGKAIGMSEALIAAIHEGPGASAFDPLQVAVMRFTDDVVNNVRASDSTFDPIVHKLGYKQAQELVMTIGFYMLVSRFLETFDVEIEAPGTTDNVKMPGVG